MNFRKTETTKWTAAKFCHRCSKVCWHLRRKLAIVLVNLEGCRVNDPFSEGSRVYIKSLSMAS